MVLFRGRTGQDLFLAYHRMFPRVLGKASTAENSEASQPFQKVTPIPPHDLIRAQRSCTWGRLRALLPMAVAAVSRVHMSFAADWQKIIGCITPAPDFASHTATKLM